MKKFLAGILLSLIAFTACLGLTACEGNRYKNSYTAVMCVTSMNSDGAYVLKFRQFKGTYVLKIANRNKQEGTIAYTASLKEGEITVYYDFNGEKTRFFDISGGGSDEGSSTEATSANVIYIIVESSDWCGGGDFTFIFKTE